ncbi:MAG: hypothetical protein ACLP9S_02650 [Syntrophales bacterium]
MLYSIDSQNRVTDIPHLQNYNIIRARLTLQEYEAIIEAINAVFDEVDIQCSSFIPGAEWEGTPYMPLYEKAALQNFDLAAQMFGLIVWVTLMDRDDAWGFERYPITGRDIEGMTYFRVNV